MDFSMTTSMSAVEWLNQQFASHGTQEQAEDFPAKLLAKLHLQMYKEQQALDEICKQLPGVCSSLARDIPQISSGIDYVAQDVSTVESLLATSGQTNLAVQKIRATETVRRRMQQTYRSLENQDNWEALLSNFKDVLASGDFDVLHARLIALKKCLTSLTDSLDSSKRSGQLEDMKNSTESALIPHLISALNSNLPWSTDARRQSLPSDAPVLKILLVFGVMERRETAKRVLRETRLKQFVHRWQKSSTQLSDINGEASFDEVVSNFYEDLLTAWHLQMPIFLTAFGNSAAQSLLELYTKVISEVNPQIESQLDKTRQSLSTAEAAQEYLSCLLQLGRSAEAFASAIEKEFHKHSTQQQTLTDFLTLLREPLNDAMKHYVDIEEIILRSEMSKIVLSITDETKSLQLLASASSRIGSVCLATLARCLQFSEASAHLPSLAKALDQAVDGHLHTVALFAEDLLTHSKLNSSEKKVDFSDSDLESLNDLLKVLLHYGDLMLQLEYVQASLHQPNPTNLPLFSTSNGSIQQKANELLQKLLAVIVQPVDKYLEGISVLPSWTNSASKGAAADIPSFGLDPQDYITRIGNYLLTLPQIMDPLLSSEGPGMKRLKSLLTFTGIPLLEDSTSMTEAWIQLAVYQAMTKFVQALMKVKHTTSFGLRQMISDMRYLQNVVEDFAVPLSSDFATLIALLTCSREDFGSRLSTSPASLLTFVKRVRNFD